MSVVTEIALRKLKNDKKRNIILMAAVGVSMALCSFFTFFKIQTQLYDSPYEGMFFDEYLTKFTDCMNVMMVFLITASFITLNTYCNMLNEENRKPLAVLSTMGATVFQKRSLILSQLFVLFIPSVVAGTLIGVIPGMVAGKMYLSVPVFSSVKLKDIALNLGAAFLLMAVGVGVVLLSYLLSNYKYRKMSVIQSVNLDNMEASITRHGYRNSNVFKSKPLLERLAKKSTEYYSSNYDAISRTFAVAALYPLVGIYMFIRMLTFEMAVDKELTVVAPLEGIFAFLFIALVLLTVLGVLLVFVLSKLQIQNRRRAIKIYISVGMPKEDTWKMILFELKSLIVRSAVYISFSFFIFYFLCQKILYPDLPVFTLTPELVFILFGICMVCYLIKKIFMTKE